MAVTGKEILLIIINVLFPPLAVFMITGCSADLCINILLGHIHGFWLIYKKHKAEKLYGPGGWVYEGNGRFAPINKPAVVGGGYGTM
ncbi:hypothetical protein FS837_009353 [Tulasnella sp. UAMH 9824]|nr:hypothetical protein FS837_009353 [Tulasnella sp. UAMH 9824]